VSRRLTVRRLGRAERDAALAYLERSPRLNLVLIDMALRLGEPPAPGELRGELAGAFRGERLVGVAAVQPSVVLDATAERAALEALFPHLAGAGTGLVKSTEDVVAPLWAWLDERGRRALLDRIEIGYALEPGAARLTSPEPGVRVRPARSEDLGDLVEAARASLREEDRPDAFEGDPIGFRRWVRTRIPRATVAECDGRVAFVGYADVRCPRGWLLQGVYTWPSWRRRGLAAAGVSDICRRAFAAGADHVQLAVVEGNTAAERLYERLGFRAFARLRTLLFA
jgi:RimJ/RimL family protein N-acetyltransferase